MKKILVSAIISTLFATSALAIEPNAPAPVGTQTTATGSTGDFYLQMKLVQERLAALKAKNDPTVNVDAIQTELTNMQNDFQARINAVMNQFRPALERLNTIPDSALSKEALASKQQMAAINAQIQSLNDEKTLKSAPFLQAYIDATKAVSTFDANRASRVAAAQKLASDTATALTTQYTADKTAIKASIATATSTISSLSKQISNLEASLSSTISPSGSVSPNYDAVKAQIATLMAQRAEAQKALDTQRLALSDLESNYLKQLNAIQATKAKAIAAIDAERKPLISARDKANNALIAVTRPYNIQISALYSKITTVSKPYNDAVRAFMVQNQAERQALSKQMESAVMAIQQEYYNTVLTFLKAKDLA